MAGRKSEFIARLEETGEEGVRENLTLGRYGGDHIGWATLWLAGIEQARAASAAASQEELARLQAAAARESADAAQVQAAEATEANRIAREARDEARTANPIATLALIAAVIAIAISSLAAFPR